MKKIIFLIAMVLALSPAWANETIIDPDLMNHDTWAEPYFPTEEEILREPSSEAAQKKDYVKNADEYLDVLKSIPASEPTISRAWLEYKILQEN